MEIILILILLLLINEIATVMLSFTGMDREMAKFQALSALTGTGFTTSESESILENRQRRRIIATLMIIGKAGVILLIAGVFHRYGSDFFSLKILFLLIVIYFIFRFISNKKVSFEIGKWVEGYFVKGGWVKKRNLEEILHLEKGYGIVELHVSAQSLFVNQPIKSTGLRDQEILILSIEEHGKVHPLPPADTIIHENDVLTCYARLDYLRKMCKDTKECIVTPKTH